MLMFAYTLLRSSTGNTSETVAIRTGGPLMRKIPYRLAGAAAVLVTLPLAVAPPVAANAVEPDYTITVNPAATGASIPKSMYGVFFEDINYAADGGLYAEL